MTNNRSSSDSSTLLCPHCHLPIEIEEVNCGIFRHGTFKSSGRQIYQHLDRQGCEQLVRDDLIYGCGRPFRVAIQNGMYFTETCGYI